MAYLDPSSARRATVFHPYSSLYARCGKRVMDLAIALSLLPFLLPIIAILAFAVACGGQRAFFAHTRVGKHGAPFKCWKIQTMVPNADAQLHLYLAAHPHAAREWAETQKLRDDPRVTILGRILRRTSLDELPPDLECDPGGHVPCRPAPSHRRGTGALWPASETVFELAPRRDRPVADQRAVEWLLS